MAAASAPLDTTTSETSRRGFPLATCGAKARSGKPCKQQAGWGTDHLGFANCKLHGGLSPTGIKHAAGLQARHLAVEVDMEPHDALLWCVRVAAGEVVFFTRKISELEETALVVESERVETDEGGEWGLKTKTVTSTDARLHIWVEGRAHAVDRLAKYAKMAVDAGVEERRVRIAETLSSELSDLLAAVFAAMGATPEQLQLARPIVHRHLLVLEGGAAA